MLMVVLYVGTLPAMIGSLTNLILLHVYNTNIAGSLPSDIGNLTKMERLEIFSNSKLTGWSELTCLSTLLVIVFVASCLYVLLPLCVMTGVLYF